MLDRYFDDSTKIEKEPPKVQIMSFFYNVSAVSLNSNYYLFTIILNLLLDQIFIMRPRHKKQFFNLQKV